MTIALSRNKMFQNNLALPVVCKEISSEEMEYVDGGFTFTWTWVGFNISVTHEERQTLTTAQIVATAGLYWFPPAAAVMGAAMGILWNYDDGNGVLCKFIWGGVTNPMLIVPYWIQPL